MKKLWSAVAVIGLVAGVYASTPTLAVASEANLATQDETTDLNLIAKSLDISYSEAVARFSGQDEFMLAISAAEAASPDTFASAEWLQTDDVRGRISFAGTPPKEALVALSDLPYAVEVTNDAPQSRADAEDGLAKTAAYLAEQGIADAEVSANTALDTITVNYDAADAPRTAARGTGLEAELDASLEAFFPAGISVQVNGSTDSGLNQQTLRGGEAMSETSGTQTCTSGFTSFRGSQWGVLTAGHCPDSTQRLAGSASNLTLVQQHQGTYGDAQFNTSADTARSNTVRIAASGTAQFRTITSTSDVAVGNSVCNYGRTRTSAACAVVQEVNLCLGTRCSLVRTNALFTNNGDSGGPWYLNNTAVGLHTGETTSGGQAVFTRVQRAMAVLSAQVYLG